MIFEGFWRNPESKPESRACRRRNPESAPESRAQNSRIQNPRNCCLGGRFGCIYSCIVLIVGHIFKKNGQAILVWIDNSRGTPNTKHRSVNKQTQTHKIHLPHIERVCQGCISCRNGLQPGFSCVHRCMHWSPAHEMIGMREQRI